MAAFNFESALEAKGLTAAQLPPEIKTKLDQLKKMCKDMVKIPDENETEVEELGEKIEELDEEITADIEAIVVQAPAPAPAPTDPAPADPAPANPDDALPITPSEDVKEEKDNTLATVGIIAGIGLLIFGVVKIFGGQAPK